jgi:hypothetical protein
MQQNPMLKMLAPRSAPPSEPVAAEKVPEEYRERALKYANAARQRELERLSKAPKHQRNNTLNKCAFKLGQFLPLGLLDRSSLVQQLGQVALQIGLDPPEIQPTIGSGLTGGSRHPRRLPFLKSAAKSMPIARSSKRTVKAVTEQLSKLGENDTDNAQRFTSLGDLDLAAAVESVRQRLGTPDLRDRIIIGAIDIF